MSDCPLTKIENKLLSQKKRVLLWLQRGESMSTLEARDEGVMHPGGRVLELRHDGWNIVTVKDAVTRVARYVLLSGGE